MHLQEATKNAEALDLPARDILQPKAASSLKQQPPIFRWCFYVRVFLLQFPQRVIYSCFAQLGTLSFAVSLSFHFLFQFSSNFFIAVFLAFVPAARVNTTK